MLKERQAKLHRWESMPKEHLSEKLDRRMITGDRMMITHIYLKKGCVVPKHHHENEQITYVLEGVLRFKIGAKGEEQRPGVQLMEDVRRQRQVAVEAGIHNKLHRDRSGRSRQ